MGYSDFLSRKRISVLPSGFDPGDVGGGLYDFQRDLVRWACRRGKAALFTMTGTGKTAMQLAWAEAVRAESGRPVLILAPLAVAQQTVREGKRIGIEVKHCRTGADMGFGVNITNYEMLHAFSPDGLGGIVLDECFPPDTPIDVFSIDGSLELRYIKDIRTDDLIYNAQGEDHVKAVYKRRINRAIHIRVNGRSITCSENHPFFTLYGWRSAQDLRSGDFIMATGTAVRLVRNGIQTEEQWPENAAVLRDILLSEMADACARTQEQSAQRSCREEKRISEVEMVQERQSYCDQGIGADQAIKSNAVSGGSEKDIIEIEADEAQTFRAWGQWTRDDLASAGNEGCIIRQLDCGICYITGETATRFSNMLQSGFRQSRFENSHRDRRAVPLQGQGQEERQQIGFFRVESTAVLEQGHPELEKYRDAEGHIYFYDIKAERHPSFSVGGMLVHNSSIIKSLDGRTRNDLIAFSRDIPYKLPCSATPSPNDYMELGNHAEFLGVMSYAEMLATFFTHDGGETSKWRLKGHAKGKFWEWLASWSAFMVKPSDLGYPDDGFDLPPLNTYQHVVESRVTEGTLFASEARGLQERQAARRESIDKRVEKCAEIVIESGRVFEEQWVVWCDLNAEQDALAKLFGKLGVSIYGSLSSDEKERRLDIWLNKEVPILITKPSIFGYGLNLQQCHNTVFVGLSDSFESIFQATRRFHRYGQTEPVSRHLIISGAEGSVLSNINRKEHEFMRMIGEMVSLTAGAVKRNIRSLVRESEAYSAETEMRIPAWLKSEKQQA